MSWLVSVWFECVLCDWLLAFDLMVGCWLFVGLLCSFGVWCVIAWCFVCVCCLFWVIWRCCLLWFGWFGFWLSWGGLFLLIAGLIVLW